MKIIIALAGFGILLSQFAPAYAQKELACIEKCNRDNVAAGGVRQTSGTAQRVRACIASCPRAKARAS
jgi:hypothetical protein